MKVNETKTIRGNGKRHVIIAALPARGDSGSTLVSRYESRLFAAEGWATDTKATHKTLKGAETWAKRTLAE